MVILIALAGAAAQPSPEALRLGRQIANAGTLATVLPVMQKKETEEILAAHTELSAAEKAQLRATSQRTYEAGLDRILRTEGAAYAHQLSLTDLRAIVAFQQGAVGKHYRAAVPEVIKATMQQIGTMDFKSDVIAAYCKETGKLCGK
jgi:hypothetical protein